MHGLIYIVCLIAAIGVVCWFLSTVTLPPFIKNLIYAIAALLLIVLIYNFATGSGLGSLR